MNQQDSLDKPLTIVGLPGSIREGSYTRMAVAAALQGAAAFGADIKILNLNDFKLPFADGHYRDEQSPLNVVEFRKAIRDADGLILGTPEYHGNVSGVLKNALDWLNPQDLEGKVIGLVGVSGGALGGVEALATLRSIGRTLHAWIVPDQAAVPQAWRNFDPQTQAPLDKSLLQRLEIVGRETARHALLRRSPIWQQIQRLERIPAAAVLN